MKNFESPETRIRYQLQNIYAETGQSWNAFVSTLETARKQSKDLLPEKRKSFIQGKIKESIEGLMATLTRGTQNVNERHLRVATSISEKKGGAKQQKSEIRELLDFLRTDSLKKEILNFDTEQRKAIFYKALREKDNQMIDVFRNNLQPMISELILNSELEQYDNEQLEKIAPGEPQLLETLSDCRSEMKRCTEVVRENIISELAKDKIQPQNFSPVSGMTDSEKVDYVDQHGLEGFKKLVDGF
jgi:hypothetical protein